jgi:hypothetical protein
VSTATLNTLFLGVIAALVVVGWILLNALGRPTSGTFDNVLIMVVSFYTGTVVRGLVVPAPAAPSAPEGRRE